MRELRGARKRRERVATIDIELIGTRAGDQRHFGAFRHFAGDQCQGACITAVNRGHFGAVDHTVRLGARHRCVTLDIGDHEVELGAAKRFDAAGIIDHLHGELRRVDAALPDLRHAAGNRVERADIHGLGRPASQWNRAKGSGSNHASRALV